MKKIAAIQMCSTHNVEENLATAADLIAETALQGADLVVLPEMFVLLGCDSVEKVKIKETAGSGRIQNFMAKLPLNTIFGSLRELFQLLVQIPKK